jgi:hypothetical protein
MTMRTSLTIATAIAITFALVTQRSFSSHVESSAAKQFQIGGVTAADMHPVSNAKPCPKGQVHCGAGCYDPRVSCCCTPTKNDHDIVRKRQNNTCNDVCKNNAKGGRSR